MTDRRLRIAVAVLAGAGAGIAAYLLHARLAGAPVACSTGGCETVQSSRYAEVLGVPVAGLGLAAFLMLLATAAGTGPLTRAAGAAVALSALVFSVYLLVVQLAVIGSVCEWCLASDGVVTLAAVPAVLRLRPDG